MSINDDNYDVPSRESLGLSENKCTRCNPIKLLLICNTIMTFCVLAFMVGLTTYLVPQIQLAKHTASNYSGDINLAKHVLEQANEFLTPANLNRVNEILNETDILLGRAMNIPMVDWDFITNTSYQTKLIYVIESFLNHVPDLGIDYFKEKYP